MRKDYDIVGSYNNQRYSPIDSERTLNLFEYIDQNGKRPKVLLPTSGLEHILLDYHGETLGARAGFVFKDILFFVFGSSVFRVTGNAGSLTAIRIGQLSTSTGYVGIEANVNQVIFVDGVKGYIYDVVAGGSLVQITDSGFPTSPIDVAFLDGFFVVPNGGTNNFYLNNVNQGLVWSQLSGTVTATDTATDILTLSSSFNYALMTPIVFGASTGGGITAGTIYYAIPVSGNQIRVATSALNAVLNVYVDITAPIEPRTITNQGQLQQGSITSHPGNIVACRTLHRRLFLFSANFTEVWENAGIGTNLPIRRNNSLLMEVGTPAIGSISIGFDQMFFLSQDRDGLGSVMQVKGTESIPISNRALDFQLAQYAQESLAGVTFVSDARGILIKENGLIFYRLNFTSANHTFVLNVSMSSPEAPRWHEEETLHGDRHPAQIHVFYKGINYYGDYSTVKFYRVDPSLMTNDGETIRRMRIGKPFTPEGYNRLRIDRFHLDLLQGNVDEIVDEIQVLGTEGGDVIGTEAGDEISLEQQIYTGNARPYVHFSYSKDGGQTYGYIIESPMGKIGERTFRTVWRKLGTIPRGQSFVPKIEFYYEVPFVVLGAAWDFEVLPE